MFWHDVGRLAAAQVKWWTDVIVMSTRCNHLTLDQLKLHAFGRINSSDLTSNSTSQHSDDDRQMTDNDKHQPRRPTEHDRTVDCGDVPAGRETATGHTSDDCLMSHSASNDKTICTRRVGLQRVSVCQSSSDCHRATELLCARTDDLHHHTGTCQSHAATHSRTDLPHSTTTRLMSLSSTTIDVERQRQRQNMELIREFTAQADCICDHVELRVDTEYLALPVTNTSSSAQLTVRTTDIISNSSSLSLYQPNITCDNLATHHSRTTHSIREVDRSEGADLREQYKRLLSDSRTCHMTTDQRGTSEAERLAAQRHQSSLRGRYTSSHNYQHRPADVCGRPAPASMTSSQMTFNSRHNATLAAVDKTTDVKKNKVTFTDDVDQRDAMST